MLQGLQMNMPLMVSSLIDHAATYHADTEIVARTIEGDIHRTTYGEAGRRTRRLARALIRLGVEPGDRVGSLAWNIHRHFEMFYGVSGMGGVLHTVNPRLFADQIVYIINHAEDRTLFVDAATLPVLEPIAARLSTICNVVMMAPRDRMPVKTAVPNLLCYEELLEQESDDYAWPEFDENAASTICYTSGTTGNPKGVVYSHRSAMLSSMLVSNMVGLGGRNGALETLMPMAPMFHGNAWEFPYVAPMMGCKLVLPGRNYEPDKLFELIEDEQVSITCGVPTMWIILTDWLDRTNRRLSRLRLTLSSGSAPPRSLVEKLERTYGVEMMQAWGMTEALGGTSATMKPGSADLTFEERIDRRMKSGRALWGVQYKIVDDAERALPHDADASPAVQGPCAAGPRPGEAGPMTPAGLTSSIDRRYRKPAQRVPAWTLPLAALCCQLATAVPASAQDSPLDALVRAYPDVLASHDGKDLVWKDGTRMPVSDGRSDKSFEDKLRHASILDQLSIRYVKGPLEKPPGPQEDPGRFRNTAFFDKMYGDCSKGEVERKLATVAWLKKSGGGSVRITTVNGVADRLRAVSEELDALRPELKTFAFPSAGTYNCRVVKDTGTRSMHAWGGAIDLNTKFSDYWLWSPKGPYRNRMPAEIVDIFERHGFIWGGKWGHFDTMHFEYRPELL